MGMNPEPIHEYQSFTCNKGNFGTQYVDIKSETTFQNLKQFILESNACGETEALDFMSVSYKKGIGEIITAKNYVGLIAMRDGTVIEILPKIHSSEEFDSKKLLIDMLRTVKELPFKAFNTTHLHFEKLPLIEVFITMFIGEMKLLLQKGLKSDYVLHQENEKFLKGKLLFNNHLKQNLTHKERFYVEYQLYNLDRPENRVIKTTLQYLYRCSKDAKNKKELQMLLLTFDNVTVSKDIDVDFNLCSIGRDMLAYGQILEWCKIFLKGNSFTNSKGSKLATALLFPMERLFESYVAEKLRRTLDSKTFNLKAQDNKHHLFEKKFAMRPDIVVEHVQEKNIVVLDTKWKLLNADSRSNYGISQSDMYQMYAYGKKYDTSEVVLLYPLNEKVVNLAGSIDFHSPENDNVNVHVRFLDLTNNSFMESVVDEFLA